MIYDTYIFDLDGTLLDTLADLASAVNFALLRHNMPQRTIEEVRRFVGNGVRKLVERAVPEGTPEAEVERVLADFRTRYSAHSMDATRPYDGIAALLAALRRSGCGVAVVSNKYDAAVKAIIAHYFGSLVSVAIGEGAAIRPKPAPDGVREALRQLGRTAERAVYIGDSDVDIATARAAGLPCVSVTWGFRSRDFLTANGATAFADTPDEIMAYAAD